MCGVSRVGNLGCQGHTSLVGQVMRCLNLESMLTLDVSSKIGKCVGTLTVGISACFGYDSRTFLYYRDDNNLTVESGSCPLRLLASTVLMPEAE